jgi:hypothetical protein
MLRRCLLAALVIAAACDSAGDDRILDLDATGTVGGAVFLDLDASGTPGAADEPAIDIQVALVREGADTIARTRTDDEGIFVFDNIPVGTYDIVVPSAELGDSLHVVFRDPPGSRVEDIEPDEVTAITVARNDTVEVELGVGYSVYTVEEARALPAGRRILVRAVALAPIDAIDDDALYIQGETRALRVTNADGDNVLPGDSVLVLGTTGISTGQRVLLNGIASLDGNEGLVDTLRVDAGTARNAGGGFYDAQLIDLIGVLVTDTATAGGRFTITVEDPSGEVAVVVPSDFDVDVGPGSELDVTGLLVPAAGVTATWQVRPRSEDDLRPRP